MKPKKIKITIGKEEDFPPRTEEEKAHAATLRSPGYTGKFFSGPMPKIVDRVGPWPPKATPPPLPPAKEKKK